MPFLEGELRKEKFREKKGATEKSIPKKRS
jgi:hypothetical protein